MELLPIELLLPSFPTTPSLSIMVMASPPSLPSVQSRAPRRPGGEVGGTRCHQLYCSQNHLNSFVVP